MSNNKFGIIVFATMVLIWAVVMALLPAHGAVSKQRNGSPLGVLQYQDNPYTYKVGSIVDADLVGDEKNPALVVRIQPLSTYGLFTEYIPLCGVPLYLFDGKNNPLVLTYRTQASRKVEGIGCHELIRVDEMQVKKELQ